MRSFSRFAAYNYLIEFLSPFRSNPERAEQKKLFNFAKWSVLAALGCILWAFILKQLKHIPDAEWKIASHLSHSHRSDLLLILIWPQNDFSFQEAGNRAPIASKTAHENYFNQILYYIFCARDLPLITRTEVEMNEHYLFRINKNIYFYLENFFQNVVEIQWRFH